ncbi:MAG TPA: ABC transporter permease [Mycobacteriales bacterium]|nr:ABC transporter permease [Mycobacteriales bacterium]
MLGYIVRRLIGVVLLLFVVSAIAFGLFFLIPANPAQQACGKACNPERIAIIEHKLGLDKPLLTQYGQFLKGIVAGRDYGEGTQVTHCPAPCFGFSFTTDQPVWELIKDRFPVTLSIAVGAAVLWLVVGVSIGIVSALRRGTWFDKAAMTFALTGVSTPVYLTGIVALFFLSATWHVLPYPTYVAFTDDPLAWAQNLIMPWFTLAFVFAAMYARLTRASMLETMGEDYIRTARAKGLPERQVVGKHGLRAALTPIVTIFGLDLGQVLGGAILTETVFGLPGLGQLALRAVFNTDLPIVMGVVLVAAFFVVIMNLAVDLVYAVLDPKVRYS